MHLTKNYHHLHHFLSLSSTLLVSYLAVYKSNVFYLLSLFDCFALDIFHSTFNLPAPFLSIYDESLFFLLFFFFTCTYMDGCFAIYRRYFLLHYFCWYNFLFLLFFLGFVIVYTLLFVGLNEFVVDVVFVCCVAFQLNVSILK